MSAFIVNRFMVVKSSKMKLLLQGRIQYLTSKMELFPKIVTRFKLLTVFAKNFVLDV